MNCLRKSASIGFAICVLLFVSCLTEENEIPPSATYLPSDCLRLITPDSGYTTTSNKSVDFEWEALQADNVGSVTYTLCLEIAEAYYLELYTGMDTKATIDLILEKEGASDTIPAGKHKWYVKAEGSKVPKTYCTSEKREIILKQTKNEK